MSTHAHLDSRLAQLRAPFDALGRTVRLRASGRRVYFMRGDGNYGDGLIRHAAECFLTDLDLEPVALDMSLKQDKLRALAAGLLDPYGQRSLFIFNGGGGWAEHCSTALRDVTRQLRVSADVLVLPSTIETMPLKRRPTIYRRDRSGSQRILPDAPFCHDMAFYLALLPQERWFGAPGRSPERTTGVFFRQDNETRIAGGNQLASNVDLSQLGNHVSDIQWFLNEIARCEHVITDRLHVAIGGLLLGRRVSLVSGATFKIRAIYESSIEPYFDNCELVTDEESLRRASS